MANWAYGAMQLNNGNIGTIFYTAAYYALPGIKSPTKEDFGPYTAEEIAAIAAGAVEGAQAYRFDAPKDAYVGMQVADTDKVFWYGAEAARAIVSHPDPLTMAEDGIFVTGEGDEVARPIA